MDWYSMSAADAVGKLSSSVDRGLSSREAEKRLGRTAKTYCAAKRKKVSSRNFSSSSKISP